MKVYRDLNEVPFDGRTALTIGSFDGVHLGHRQIIDALTERARSTGGRSVVVTFDPHPQVVLRRKGDSVPILTSTDEKIEQLESLGVDVLVIVHFTEEFASTPWKVFCDLLLERVGIDHMIVGYDHAFGQNREGNAETLRGYGAEHNFEVVEVEPLLIRGDTISSTKIRRAITSGELDLASEYLGRPYSLQGRVVRGDGRGRKLGIPTANIAPLDPDKLVPSNGVYCVGLAVDGERHRGMANIGVRPSFTEGVERTIEANLFDFDRDIYERVVTLEFRKFVRSEQTFASAEAFLEQLERDRSVCRMGSGEQPR